MTTPFLQAQRITKCKETSSFSHLLGRKVQDLEALAEKGQLTLELGLGTKRPTIEQPQNIGSLNIGKREGRGPWSGTQWIKYNKSCEANQIPSPQPHTMPNTNSKSRCFCKLVTTQKPFLVIGWDGGGALLRMAGREGFWDRSRY